MVSGSIQLDPAVINVFDEKIEYGQGAELLDYVFKYPVRLQQGASLFLPNDDSYHVT